MADREGARRVFERDDAVAISDEFANVRVLLELELRAERRGCRCESKFDTTEAGV